MHYREFYYWCREAVSKIRYIPDKNKVYNELFDHLLDRYEGYIARGIPEDEAVQKTLDAMGDPKALAVQLGKIHKPYWAYAMVATRFVALILFFLMLGRFINFAHDQNYLQRAKFFHEDPYSENISERISYVTPDVKDTEDGYTFHVEKAALWDNRIMVRLKVTNPLPWTLEQAAVLEMTATDSNGSVYPCHNQYKRKAPHRIFVESEQMWLTTYYYDLYLYGSSPDVQWLVLTYDRAGRDIRLYIDLTGGEEQCGE